MTSSEIDRKVLSDIQQTGWSCLTVTAEDGQPGYSYTVGWPDSYGVPEVAIFGLDPDQANDALWALFEQVVDGLELHTALTLDNGMRLSGLVGKADCIARPIAVEHCEEMLRFSNWYHRLGKPDAPSVSALQIFWPDKKTRKFPWDADASAQLKAAQPILQD